MLFDDDGLTLTRGRAIVLILAIFGLGWLCFRIYQPNPARLSLWSGSGTAQGQVVAASAQGQPNILSAFLGPLMGRGNPGELQPQGNPLGAPNTVITQGYGSGTHVPAAVWGAVDLAIDSDGDGEADPQGSWGQPIYATHTGRVKVTTNSWPAGNHIWVTNEAFRTGYAHLQEFAVKDGQIVERGQLIGYMGSSGMSSGPHLDYQIWQMQNGRWVNLNPLDFGALDGT
ncbi:MAG: M23 family metallopeptidase [Chloroflexales bacterium]|nr:M23 family metallopeptidase [Chloroflexales bacterium]